MVTTLAINMDNYKNIKQYVTDMKFIVNQYNKKWSHTALNQPPASFLAEHQDVILPWGTNDLTFSFHKNNSIIEKKIKKIKTLYPKLTPVRVNRLPQKHLKRSITSTWSEEV